MATMTMMAEWLIEFRAKLCSRASLTKALQVDRFEVQDWKVASFHYSLASIQGVFADTYRTNPLYDHYGRYTMDISKYSPLMTAKTQKQYYTNYMFLNLSHYQTRKNIVDKKKKFQKCWTIGEMMIDLMP
jgi:predicted oxidoreductase (fatty acid repression mutant protein)